MLVAVCGCEYVYKCSFALVHYWFVSFYIFARKPQKEGEGSGPEGGGVHSFSLWNSVLAYRNTGWCATHAYNPYTRFLLTCTALDVRFVLYFLLAVMKREKISRNINSVCFVISSACNWLVRNFGRLKCQPERRTRTAQMPSLQQPPLPRAPSCGCNNSESSQARESNEFILKPFF